MRTYPALAMGVAVLAITGCAASNTTPALLHQQPSSGPVRKAASNSSITASGSIVGLISGGFTLNGGAGYGNVHVYTSGATVTGAPVAVGNYANVNGTGSFATSITATSVIVSTGTIGPSSAVEVTGPVQNLISGGFTMNGGPEVGNIHIYTNSGTQVNAGPVHGGAHALVTGSGSLATSVTAGWVGLFSTAPSTLTLNGTVVATTPFGFTANAGPSYPAVPVALQSQTIVGGGTLAPGAHIAVTGLGAASVGVIASRIVVASPTPSPGATPTATPPPISQTHVTTMDYLGGLNGTHSIAWSAAQPYLNWAETNTADAPAIHAAGIKTIYYIDPNRTVPGDAMYTSNETTFAHDCSNNRVTDTYGASLTQYVMDVTQPATQSLFASTVANVVTQAPFDAIFEDDAGALSAFATYAPFSAMPCNYTDAAWIAGGSLLNDAPSVPIFFNGLSGLSGHNVSLSSAFYANANVEGGIYEGCYTASNQPKMSGWLWDAIENTELYAVAQGKPFECLELNESSAASQTDARLYAYASFLLTYDPARDIVWSLYSTSTGLHVMPESELVALQPKVSAPSQISSLELTGGAYGREYAQCFIHGAFAGPCAVVVNPGATSVPFPYVTYTHGLVLSGSGVLDGGTMSTTGTVPTTLAPSEAAIVFP